MSFYFSENDEEEEEKEELVNCILKKKSRPPPVSSQESAASWTDTGLDGAMLYQPTSAHIAVDYFLKKLANKEISLR